MVDPSGVEGSIVKHDLSLLRRAVRGFVMKSQASKGVYQETSRDPLSEEYLSPHERMLDVRKITPRSLKKLSYYLERLLT